MRRFFVAVFFCVTLTFAGASVGAEETIVLDGAVVILNFDDCGVLSQSTEGCLLFYPDNHRGIYTLENYGAFGAGDIVHVQGVHNASYGCPCKSSCIKANSITMGCSVTCSEIPRDVDNSGAADIGDVVALVCVIFQGCDYPICLEQADCDGSGFVDINDLVWLLQN